MKKKFQANINSTNSLSNGTQQLHKGGGLRKGAYEYDIYTCIYTCYIHYMYNIYNIIYNKIYKISTS